MALTYSAATQFLSKATALLTAPPMSFACWFQSNSYSSNPGLVTIDNGPTQTQYFVMYLGSTGTVHVGCASGGTSGDVASSTTQTAGGWGHAAVVFASTASRSSYCNGGGKSTNATSVTPTGLTRSTFACSTTNTTTLAWGGIWSIALSDQDVMDLYLGAHPLKVHPEALVACQDFDVNAPTRDLVSPTAWTVNGTAATTFNNTGIVRPSRNKKFSYPRASVNFAGTAQIKSVNTGAPTVSRLFAAGATPPPTGFDLTQSGIVPENFTVGRSNIGGTATPAMVGSGFMSVPAFIHTLRVSAAGSMSNPTSSIIFAGNCLPAMIGSGVITVSKTLAGVQTSIVVASGAITIIQPKLFTGRGIVAVSASGTIFVPQQHPVMVGVTGLYVVQTDWNTYGVWTLVAGIDYEYALMNVESGPFPDYGSALAYIETNFFGF